MPRNNKIVTSFKQNILTVPPNEAKKLIKKQINKAEDIYSPIQKLRSATSRTNTYQYFVGHGLIEFIRWDRETNTLLQTIFTDKTISDKYVNASVDISEIFRAFFDQRHIQFLPLIERWFLLKTEALQLVINQMGMFGVDSSLTGILKSFYSAWSR